MLKIVKKKYFELSLLFFFILIGFLIRIIILDKHPPIDVDEYSIAYNALTISKSGKDEWGVRYPLFFKAFGDYKLPFDIYLTALLYKLFSPNFFLLRLFSAVFGTLYIPLIYFLLKMLIKSKLIVFLGIILTTFSPTNIYFSRIISGSISQSFFTFFSIFLFLFFLKKNNKLFLFLSTFSLSLSLYCYPSSWIIAPLLILFYSIIIFIKRNFLHLLLNAIVFLIFLTPIINQLFLGGSQIRFANVSKNTYTGNVLEINEFRHHTKNDLLSKIFHNKITYYSYNLTKNYLSHFDIPPLVFGREILVASDSPFPFLFFITLPFYYLGIFTLFKKIKKIEFVLIIFWIFISPLSSFITDSGLHSKRYLTFLGSEVILISLGLDFIKFQKQKKLFFPFFLIIFAQIIYFLYYYFFPFRSLIYNRIYYKANLLYHVVKNNYHNYDYIIYTTEFLGEPQIYPLFATLMPVDLYVKEKKFICNPWCFIKPFNKFYFSDNIDEISSFINKNNNENKILGFFSQEEINNLVKNNCYQTKENLISKEEPKNNFYLVEFKKCQ